MSLWGAQEPVIFQMLNFITNKVRLKFNSNKDESNYTKNTTHFKSILIQNL